MKPYSIDFRQKLIEVYEQEKTSIRKLAQGFRPRVLFKTLLSNIKKQAILDPNVGSPPTKLNSEQLVSLVEIMETNNNATLEELCELLYEKTWAKMGIITQKLNSKKNFAQKKNDILEKRVKYGETLTLKTYYLWMNVNLALDVW